MVNGMTRTYRRVFILGLILLISSTVVKVSNSFPTSVSAAASPDFSITVNPSSLSIVAGYTGNATVQLTSLNGFSGAVALSASRVGTCCNATLNPATLTLTSGGAANSTLSISTFSYMGWGGPGPVNITGTSGVLTHLARLSLTISKPYPSEDFQISVNPALDTRSFVKTLM